MFDLQHAEKLVDCTVEMKSELSGAFTSTFELVIPSILFPTIALPSVEVSYAVVAQTILPSGQSLYAHQVLRISKRWLELPSLMPSPRITFPESPLAVKVRFAKQDAQTRHLPITLHLKGLDSPPCGASSVPSVSWIRESEVRKMTPRTIQWELEEKAIVISGPSTDGNMLAMSHTTRSEQARIISKGKYQPVLHYPFKTSADAEVESEIDIHFNAHIPKDTELPDAGELTTFGDRVVRTLSSPSSGPDSVARRDLGARFAVHMEHSLRVSIHLGEDTFHKKTGSLVHRRPAQFAYSVVVPLKVVRETSSGRDCQWVTGLPTYEAAMGSPPTYSINDEV